MASIKQMLKINEQDRKWFVKFWANYVKKNTNKVWSAQQKMLIDSQISNAGNFRLTPKAYLDIKQARGRIKEGKFYTEDEAKKKLGV